MKKKMKTEVIENSEEKKNQIINKLFFTDVFIQKIKERGYKRIEDKKFDENKTVIFSKHYTQEEEFNKLPRVKQLEIMEMDNLSGNLIDKLGTSYRIIINYPYHDYEGDIHLTNIHVFKLKHESKVNNLQQVIFLSKLPDEMSDIEALFKLFKF
jgi:hypothetical protein